VMYDVKIYSGIIIFWKMERASEKMMAGYIQFRGE